MNKFLAFQKDVFDINKVTVVGEPTITSDGLASGFSDGNQLKTNYVFKPDSKGWKIQGEFTTGEDITTSQWIFSNLDFGVRLIVMNGSIRTIIGSTRYGMEISSATNSTYPANSNTLYSYSIEYNATTKTYTREINGDKVVLYTGDLIVYQNSSNNELNKIIIGSSNTMDFMLGSIDLTQFKIYVDNQLVYTPTKPTYLLERRKPTVWDKEQFTVVGSPVISDSGVASGFSNENYLTIPNYLKGKRNYEIDIEFTLPETLSQYGYIFCEALGTTGLSVYYDSTYIYVRSVTAGVNRFTKSIVKGNYKLKIKYNNGSASLKYRVNNAEEQTYQLNVSNYVDFQEDILYLSGRDKYGAIDGALIGGSINLKSIKIYTDGNLVFDGGRDRYLYDPSKFTVVGSPTITEAGVASGFDNSDYIQIKNQKLGNTTKIRIKAKRQTLGSTNETFFRIVDGSGTVLRFYFNASGSMDYVCDGTYGILGFSINNTGEFILNIEITPEQFKFSCFQNAQEIEATNPIRNRDYISVFSSSDEYYMDLGSYSGVNGLLGSIDLTQFSITVDGKEVFTGAEQKFYMLRR